MNTAGKRRTQVLYSISILLILAGLGLAIFYGTRSEKSLLTSVEEAIEDDFRDMVEETAAHSEKLARQFSVGKEADAQDGNIRLSFQSNCKLLEWNDPEWMPSSRIISDLCNFPNRRILQDKNKVYYYLRHEHNGYLLVTLIPIQVTYKVQNSNLPPYLFLGRYNGQSFVEDQVPRFDLHLRQTDNAATVFDEAGNFVFALTLPGVEVFSYRGRALALILLAAGVCLLFWLGWKSLSKRFGPRRMAIAFSVMLLVVRGLALYLGFPSSFLPMELFSPTLLAIDNLTPSLGDLMLNVIVFLLITVLIFGTFHRDISRVYRKILGSKQGVWSWILHVYILGFSIVLITFFFHELDQILLNSKINFEFSNVFELNIYSIVAFLVVGMMLLGLQVVLYHLLRFSYHFLLPDRRPNFLRMIISLGVLVGVSIIMWGWSPPYILVVVFSVILTMVILGRTKEHFIFRLDILNFLFAITLFSMLTSVGIATGDRTRRKAEMELIADRLSDEHDLIAESLFERVRREVRDASFILQYSKGNIARGLRESFFEQSFKGYEVRVYVYDQETQEMVDGDIEAPFLHPNSGINLEEAGISTMTDNLYLMPYFQNVFDYIYIGEFDLLMRQFGWLLVQVELRPTEIRPNQLYPNLLLDDNIRSKAFVSKRFDYAIYRDGKMFRKLASGPFPRLLTAPKDLSGRTFVHEQEPHYDEVYYKASDQKTIVVRTERQGFFDIANLFSFIFYFNILSFTLIMLPFWMLGILRRGRKFFQGSLRTQIQVLFLSLSVVPLFIVIFLLSPYIKQHIYEELSTSLQDETARVASLVREYYQEVKRPQPGKAEIKTLLKSKLAEIEKTVFNDVNIYQRNGLLDFTTQPSIYELGLNSEYMHPEVYENMRSGKVFDAVVEEQIGKLSYFSGYYPLINNNREVMGYLNIPFLKNQDQVNEQALSLLTFLVDIYVFVFLALGFIAVLVSNSIIRPLSLLSLKLEATTLGKTNEPIEWESSDEIGEIIHSYNQMLEKLAESEQKLARNERELAWKEMARQVAHEIKNPLTPMKLSIQHLIRAWGEDSEKLERMFHKVTKTILVQIDSLTNIANSFSEFGKMPEPRRSTFDLQAVVKEVAELYEHHEEVQLKVHLPEAGFPVHSDRDQLSRVFNNLVKNGIQAIDHDAGVISIDMKVEGNWAHIDIQDNGKGIPDDIRKKIFQPNFSTKSSGMGMGLAIVRRIIESAGGTIDFESEVGEGTTFHIVLPEAKAD